MIAESSCWMMQLGGCIAPHFFELVKCSRFRLHDVNDYVYIVHQNPFGMLEAFLSIGEFTGSFLYLAFNAIGNGFYLSAATGLANDKKIGYRFMNLAQV